MTVWTEDGLGKALKSRDFPIVVSSQELVGNIESIRSPGRIAWIGAVGALVGMLCLITPGMIGAGLLSWPLLLGTGATVGSVAVAVLGGKATIAALKIAYAGGGVEVLNVLRSRSVTESSDEKTLTIK